MAAYTPQASNGFPSLFVESQNSCLESSKGHGGASNGLLGLHVDSNSSGSTDCLEYGFLPHGDSGSGKIVPSSSPFYKDSDKMEIPTHFEVGILEIFIHHATGIHNICIYDNQDVYAKFCFSHNPEETLCSRVVKKGGRNPVFNESLQIAIAHVDSVLKCEIWMSSLARSYLEDQLLGFVLIPVSSIIEKGKLSQDYCLSSTDLIHSDAGILKLTLTYLMRNRSVIGSQLNGKLLPNDSLLASLQSEGTGDSSIPSAISALSSPYTETEKLSGCDYNHVEFQDMHAIAEDQQLVSSYLSAASNEGESRDDLTTAQTGLIIGPPFLQLHASPADQAGHSERIVEVQHRDMSSVSGNCQLFSFFSTPVLNSDKDYNGVSDISERVSDISERQSSPRSHMEANGLSPTNYRTSCSQIGTGTSNSQDSDVRSSAPDGENGILAGSFEVPCVNISIDTEPNMVQQDIVDMYMKSMQQFTEALAKMQLPMDIDHHEAPPDNKSLSEHDSSESGKKNSHRVFYGSRAFF